MSQWSKGKLSLPAGEGPKTKYSVIQRLSASSNQNEWLCLDHDDVLNGS